MSGLVLVVGAGPVGLTAAIELARRGAAVRIVDKASGPKAYTKAGVLWPRTLEVLDLMGAVGRFAPMGTPWHRLVILDANPAAVDRRIGEIRIDGGIESPHPLPLLLGQNVTERLLAERLAELGVRVEWNAELAGLDAGGNGAQAGLRHGDGRQETVVASFVVGCDGGSSFVREHAGIGRDGGRYEGTEFLLADVRLTSSLPLPPGTGYAVASETAMCFIVPILPDGTYRVAMFRQDADPGNHADPSVEEIQELARMVVVGDAELLQPTWLNRYRTSHHLADTYRRGRVLLVGDAAHTWAAVGGQGMNTGIQDGFNLGWKLAAVVKGEAPDHLLDSYEAERRPVAQAMIRQTSQQYDALAHPGRVMRWVAGHVLPTLLGSETFQGGFKQRFVELDIAYPDSPLNGGPGGGVAGPGMRAPDAWVGDAGTKDGVRLFDLYRRGGWTLLAFTGTGATGAAHGALAQALAELAAAFGRPGLGAITVYLVDAGRAAEAPRAGMMTLADTAQSAHAAYGVREPCLCLVRPDGYVGFRDAAGQASSLVGYLEGVFTEEDAAPPASFAALRS